MKSRPRWEIALEKRRAEQELFFWRAFKYLSLIVAAVFVANFVFCVFASWIQGDPSGWELLLRFLI